MLNQDYIVGNDQSIVNLEIFSPISVVHLTVFSPTSLASPDLNVVWAFEFNTFEPDQTFEWQIKARSVESNSESQNSFLIFRGELSKYEN